MTCKNSSKTVLICDDSAFMRRIVRMVLEKNHFKVIGEAEDGCLAVKKYIELKPDIVTMDITMPHKSCFAALLEIMKFDVNARILMLTAIGQDVVIKQAMDFGAKGFVVKPFTAPTLVKAINNT